MTGIVLAGLYVVYCILLFSVHREAGKAVAGGMTALLFVLTITMSVLGAFFTGSVLSGLVVAALLLGAGIPLVWIPAWIRLRTR